MIFTLEGPMGSSKTTTAVMLAHYNWERREMERESLRKARQEIPPSRKVISNVPLSFPHEFFTMQYFKEHVFDAELTNCEIIFDEPYNQMDSHLAASPGARALAKFGFEARKRHVNLYFCTHRMSYLLNRVRDLINMNGIRGSCRCMREWPCKKCKGTGAYPAHGEIIEAESYERYTGKDQCDRCLGYGKVEISETWFTNKRRLVFNMLDTQINGAKNFPLTYTANYYWDLFPTENRVAMQKATFERIDTEELGWFEPKGKKLDLSSIGRLYLAHIDGDLMKKSGNGNGYEEIAILEISPTQERVKIKKVNLPKKPAYWLDNDGRINVVEVLGQYDELAEVM